MKDKYIEETDLHRQLVSVVFANVFRIFVPAIAKHILKPSSSKRPQYETSRWKTLSLGNLDLHSTLSSKSSTAIQSKWIP
ncbi:hypothetical protein VI817_001903 [Penicillium citrinum]|nr:hypothetical protein VI817_001903 [Penicillium citrinum]